MTFTQLRCFIEVAHQLNFARAAETLYISQPAVSRQIHALENELGVRLFDRTRHVVALTSAGESFYHDTVDMLDRLTLAVQRAQNTQALFSEELHVGYSGSMQIQKLPQIYQQYQKRCPQGISSTMRAPGRSGPAPLTKVYRTSCLTAGTTCLRTVFWNTAACITEKWCA